MKDYNSSENQRIKEKFVDREVIMSASDIVQAFDDIDEGFFATLLSISLSISSLEQSENFTDQPEIYEWYFVTNKLANDLEARGEVIIRYFNFPLWGRQETGQAILLDNVISDICESMEILKGQQNEWKI